jgi:hypothetical protein
MRLLLIFVTVVALSLANQMTRQNDDRIRKRRPWHHHLLWHDVNYWVTTRTERETSTTTLIVTSSTVSVCAQLVNVTGACRRRKGLLVDEPLVLSFDDEIDDAVDVAFSPSRPIE